MVGRPPRASCVSWAAALDSRLAEQASRLDGLVEEMSDVAAYVRRYVELLDSDPTRLEAIESRLAVLDGLKRKHGGSIDSVVQERQRLEVQVGATEDLDSAVSAAAAEERRRRAELDAAAARLTKARAAAASRMERAVATELEGLRLEGARFEVALRALGEVAASGAEAVEIMFSANPGEPIAPLAKVASGGELARVMLAIKTAGAGPDKIPTL